VIKLRTRARSARYAVRRRMVAHDLQYEAVKARPALVYLSSEMSPAVLALQ